MGFLPHIFAIDWSGDRSHAAGKIWLAQSCDGRLIRLEKRVQPRSHHHIPDRAIEARSAIHRRLRLCVLFSLWFCEQLRAKTVVDVWRHAAQTGEQWLTRCAAPFWGRRGTTCLPAEQRFRETEKDVAHRVSGARPKSVFQIGGPGAVGTGSFRGMPILERLREAGFSIWPFDPPGGRWSQKSIRVP
jgi:hypothetical protein